MTLSFKQTKQAILACIRAHVTPIIVGSPGCGKCLGEGTPVLLADGRVLPVEQIVVGDRLMGPDGKARIVLSTTMGRAPLYRIEPLKGEPWVCNDVHVLTLVNSYTDEVIDISLDKWHASGSSFKHDHKQFSVGVESFENQFDRAGSQPIDPYFLGAWFGDGSKSLRHNVGGDAIAKVAISKPDPEILAICEEQARKWELHVRTEYGTGGCPTHNIADEKGGVNRLLQTLRDLVGPQITIPDAYLRASRAVRLQFLAGFLDTDAELAETTFVITQEREDWARAAWWLARSLGFYAGIRPRTATYKRKDGTIFEGTYWVVSISGDTDQIPTRIPHKQARPRQQIKTATRTGFVTVPLGEGDYYGFTLNGDGRFLLGDFTVTHNTALIRAVSQEAGLPCHELLASNCDAVDIAGLPYIVDGELRRALLPQIRACIDNPGVLFLDELTSVPPSVQAPLMRLLLENYAGGEQLHPGSSVVGAANRPEECPGGIELSAATTNRIIRFVEFQPTLDEIRGFFDGVGDDGTRLHEEFLDFAATLAVSSDLLDMNPPRAAIDAGLPFASPRAWERGLRVYAEYCEAAKVGFNVGKHEDDIGYALLSGAVGETKAAAFLGIRKMRKHLPTIDEILRDPNGAKCPEQKDRQIAAVGLLARVAEQDTWAAWIYAERLLPEISAACASVLMRRTIKGTAKWQEQGARAQVRGLAKIRRALA
jgi:hypothetical protein